MGALKAHEVDRFINRPDLTEGVFLAYGPDAGLVREVGYRLSKRFAGTGADDMNLLVLDGSELDADPSRLAMEARTTSLFGDRRVIRVRGAGKGLATVLAALVADPAGAVIIIEAGNLTPKDALRAMVEGAKLGRALPCYPDNDKAIGELIAETFNTAGIAIHADAMSTLRDQLGNDREITRRELEKLALYAASSKRLTREDVLTLCADNAALVLDQVVDAMGEGHASDLEAALARALANAVNPQQILAAALNHFAGLRRWRTEVEQGKPAGAVLDSARPKPHFSRRASMERQLRIWSDESLSVALERLQAGVSDSRKTYDLQEAIARRTFLAVTMLAAER
jgi:DNA polymerase-3 subunit delta